MPPFLGPKNKCSTTRLDPQNEQEIQREGMKLGSKEGGLYPALMFSLGSEVLPSWLRCVVWGVEGLGPWPPGIETPRRWTLYSYLFFFLRENTRNPWLVFANTRRDSLSPGEGGHHYCIFFLTESTAALAHSVFSSLANPEKTHSFIFFVMSNSSGKWLSFQSWENPAESLVDLFIPFRVEKELFYYLSELFIKSSFCSVLHFSYRVGTLLTTNKLPLPPQEGYPMCIFL